MEPQVEKKSRKKLLIFIIILLLLGAGGFAAYWFLIRKPIAPSISLTNGKMYPTFSAETTSYTIYTSESSLSFSCTGEGTITGCDSPVATATGESTHHIAIGNHSYTFSITRLDPSDTTLKIKSVRGNPTTWVTQAELTVAVENSGPVKELEYSFDGGKTWRDSNIGLIAKNGTYKIVARDYFGFLSDTKDVKVTKVDSEKPIVNIAKEQTASTNTAENQAILTAVITEELSGIKGIKWNTDATTESITVHTGGTYTVTVTDKAGNVTKKSITVTFKDSKEESSSLPDTSGGNQQGSNTPAPTPTPTPTPTPAPTPTPTPTPVTHTFVAQFVGNGASASRSSASCATTDTSCVVRTASISRAGWEIVGWATNPNATTSEYPINTDIRISGNIRLYAITRKTISGSFTLRDANAATVSGDRASCTVYNASSSCDIITPTLTAKSGYTVVGWNTSQTSAAHGQTPGASVTISDNTVFYSVTYLTAPLTANFIISDPNAATKSGGVPNCLLYNGATSCSLQAPTLTAKSGYTVDGWHDSEHDVDATPGANFTVTASTSGRTYYAVTHTVESFSATFNLQDSAHLAKSTTTTTCTPANGSCTITIPTLSVTDAAYEVIGWSTNATATAADGLGATLTLTATNNGVAYYSISRRKAPLIASFVVRDSAALATTGSLMRTCYLYNGATSCSASVPSVSTNNGYTFDGWAYDTLLTPPDVTAVTINSDKSFYSHSHRNTPRSATFNITNPSISRFSDNTTDAKTVSCYLYDGANTCDITSPGINTNSGHTALGWAANSSATTTDFTAGSSISLDKNNQNYYSVVASAFTVTFVSSDPAHLTFAGGATTTTQICSLASASSCTVNFPAVTTSDGREFIGWATAEGSTTVSYSAADHPTVSSAVTYYTVSKKTVTLSFSLVDAAHFSLSSSSASCTLYNSASGCSISAPSVSAAANYALLGWATSSGATTYSWNGSAHDFSANANYYSVSRYSKPAVINYVIPSDHTGKITVPRSSDNCYVMNGADSCVITMSSATPTSSNYTFSGWGNSPDSYNSYFPAGLNLAFTINDINNYSSGITFYAIVGTVRSLTFANNPTVTSGGSGISGNNLQANAISFISGQCITYDNSKCYVKTFPRIYAHGKDVYGFSGQKLGSTIIFPSASTSVSSNATLYSRVWDDFSGNVFTWRRTYMIGFSGASSGSGSWSDATPDSMPDNGAEYYPVEFDDTVDSGVATAYGEYIANIFSKLPGATDFHGRLRFIPDNIYGSANNHAGSDGITMMNGQFAQVDVRLETNTSGKVTEVSNRTKYTIIHELGHAMEALINDRAAFNLRATDEFKNLRKACYNLRKSGQDCLSDYAFYNVTYDSASDKFVPTAGHSENDADVDGNEFFAELFSAWYIAKFSPGISINAGTTHSTGIPASLNADAGDFLTRVLQVPYFDYNTNAYYLGAMIEWN